MSHDLELHMILNFRGAAGALIVAAAVACGGGGATVTGPTGGPTGASCGTNTICMQFTAPDAYSAGTGTFAPSALTVTTGSTVKFTNNSGVSHNVVFDAAAPTGGDIGVISSGTQTRTFSVAGSYPFHCTVHQGMTGTITVQ